MAKNILISCVSKKLDHKSKAEDLYISTLFKYNLQYAKSLGADRIFILSAKHGLLNLEEEIEPYNQTLNNMKAGEIRKWSNKVLSQLKDSTDIKNDNFLFLAGASYRKNLLPHISNYEIPLEGMRIGEQLQHLKKLCQR
ncbi:DUF6884 domain-containing protein [Methanolobus sp. WCC1]|uniref:DUF6884 domain-containing protein n=1 Tax=unclassified Methanolobus TaxID=2629569 RepID=UPI0032460254